jgi:hypothetical protein
MRTNPFFLTAKNISKTHTKGGDSRRLKPSYLMEITLHIFLKNKGKMNMKNNQLTEPPVSSISAQIS